MELTEEELDLCRQWFNAVQCVTPEYLESKDYQLAKKIHDNLGVRCPLSINKKLPELT